MLKSAKVIFFNILSIFIISIGLFACRIAPYVEYNFSYLGNTQLDGIIKEDVDKYRDFPVFKDNKLPKDNPLVKSIIGLLYKDKTNLITVNDIEKIGGICETAQHICVYQGVVTYQYFSLPSSSPLQGKIFTLKYKVLFNHEEQPVGIEVLRIKT